MGLLSAVLSVLGILFAGPLVSLFADGYDAQTAELAVSLTRVMFPTVLFTGWPSPLWECSSPWGSSMSLP